MTHRVIVETPCHAFKTGAPLVGLLAACTITACGSTSHPAQGLTSTRSHSTSQKGSSADTSSLGPYVLRRGEAGFTPTGTPVVGHTPIEAEEGFPDGQIYARRLAREGFVRSLYDATTVSGVKASQGVSEVVELGSDTAADHEATSAIGDDVSAQPSGTKSVRYTIAGVHGGFGMATTGGSGIQAANVEFPEGRCELTIGVSGISSTHRAEQLVIAGAEAVYHRTAKGAGPCTG